MEKPLTFNINTPYTSDNQPGVRENTGFKYT